MSDVTIPQALAHRPVIGGLVAPWVNVVLADGGVDFKVTHHSKWEQAWLAGICQTCGLELDRPVVLLGGPNQLDTYFTEPPLHRWCAVYAQQACPMVAGQRATYAKAEPVANGKRGARCPDPRCDCGGWVPHEPERSTSHAGEPAHAWYAVLTADWTVAVDTTGRVLGGVPTDVRRVRLISMPPTDHDLTGA